MKNYIKLYTPLVTFLLFAIVGCKKNNHTNYSTLVNKNSQLNDFVPSLIGTVEKDTVFEFPFTLSEAPIVDMHISVKKVSGTATEGADFEILTPDIVIPAHRTSGVIQIGIKKDDIVEGSETFVIQVGDSTNPNVKVFKNITVNLTDYIGPTLDISFSWNTNVFVPGTGTVPTGPNFDIDIYVLDADGFDTEDYSAATGASPEGISYTVPEDTGTYYFAASLYNNVFRVLSTGLTDLQPITMEFHRDGTLGSFTKTQPDSVAFNLDSPDADNDGDFTLVDLAKLVVGPSTFMVYDVDGTSLVNARTRNLIHNNKKPKPNNSALILN